MSADAFDVCIVGGGVAGRSASVFTARADLDTVIADRSDPILRRNAHLENYPGFPAGINSRLLLDSMREQAEKAGATFVEARVTSLAQTDDGFAVETDAGDRYTAAFAIAATKNETDYLADLEGLDLLDRG